MDLKSAALGAVASGAIAIGGVIGLNLAGSGDPKAPVIITGAEATATAMAAPVPDVSCPAGWVPVFGGWQPRSDGRAYLACDFKETWNLAIVNDGSKVLTKYKGGDIEQYVQTPDGGDNVDELVQNLH